MHPQPAGALSRSASLDEADLVARVRAKDETAIRALIQQHNRRLYRLARGVVRNDSEAEDVVQEAYVRALTHFDSFRGESGVGTWLGRIVLNEALGRLRQRRPTVDWESVERSEPTFGQIIQFPLHTQTLDPERAMAQHQIHGLVEEAIEGLPDPFRLVLIARLVEEMSVEETASLLDILPETVKTRLHRARKLLRSALEKTMGPVLTEAFPFEGWRCADLADRVLRRLA